MRELNRRQRAWVIAKVWLGARDGVKAAQLGGYEGTTGANGSMRVHAHWTAHNPKVQAALREEADRLLKLEGAQSVLKLTQLRDGAQSEQVQLKAAEALLNRGGYHVVEERHVHEHRDGGEDLRLVGILLRQLGVREEEVRRVLEPPSVELKPDGEGGYRE